jgi:hypothetical protein
MKTRRSSRLTILLVASLVLAGILACQAGGEQPLPPQPPPEQPPPTQPPPEQPPPTQPPPEQPPATPAPGAPGVPDLAITNLTLSNLTPAPGEEIIVGVTILNQGTAVAENFHWAWDPGTGEGYIQDETPIASLVPGDDIIREITYTYQQEGGYAGQAWADSRDAYAEPNETDNIAHVSVSVGVAAPVDLAITNLTLSNLTPVQGEEIIVGVTIMNFGGAPAQDFHWSWDPGTGEGPIHSEAIAFLAPGDDVVLEMTYTYQVFGEYMGEAKADSRDAYDEPNETDNIAHVDVNVGARPT